MKKCEKCGHEYREDYLFCPSCGGELIDAEILNQKNTCPECGTYVPDEFVFCPECGTKVNEDEKSNAANEKIETAETNGKDTNIWTVNTPDQTTRRKATKKKITIAAICVGVLIVAILAWIVTPRELILNSGEDVEVYANESSVVSVDADGLTAVERYHTVWTSDDPNLITVENGILEASYDKNAFNASYDSEGSDVEEGTYTSYIHGEVKKGLRKWKGDAYVIVRLRPVPFKNGEVIKKPADSRDSYFIIKGSKNYSTYFYLKSKTKSSNDMSFLVKKGEKAKVYVPCDKYIIYEASGKTWYGKKILFGPKTFYTKDKKALRFTSTSYWTLKLNVENGNVQTKDINSEDFPD
ncbi:MAG: zinc-ribbon domain-containing protein [Firmicutes bacterium]|nr:zinc-ribbon domain-containing protein [Bacillota bacterium]